MSLRYLTLRSLCESLDPPGPFIEGVGCCDCIRLIKRSVWEFGTCVLFLSPELFFSSGFDSSGLYVGTT